MFDLFDVPTVRCQSCDMQNHAASVSTSGMISDQAVYRSRSLPLSRLAGTGKVQKGSQPQCLAGFGSTTLLQVSLDGCLAPFQACMQS